MKKEIKKAIMIMAMIGLGGFAIYCMIAMFAENLDDYMKYIGKALSNVADIIEDSVPYLMLGVPSAYGARELYLRLTGKKVRKTSKQEEKA